MELSKLLRPGSGVLGHHFYHIWLCKASHKAKPDSRGRKIDSASCCEEQDARTELGEAVGGRTGAPAAGVDRERRWEL